MTTHELTTQSAAINFTMARARAVTDPSKISSTTTSSSMASPAIVSAESAMIDHFMAQARAKYAAQPELLPQESASADTEMMILDGRADAALGASDRLLSEAQAQLAAPCVAPEMLTADEVAEIQREEEWDRVHDTANALNDAWLDRNNDLFDDVMRLIDQDDCEDDWVHVPRDIVVSAAPVSPTLTQMHVPGCIVSWTANSKKKIERTLRRVSSSPSPKKDRKAATKGKPSGFSDLFAPTVLDRGAPPGLWRFPDLWAM